MEGRGEMEEEYPRVTKFRKRSNCNKKMNKNFGGSTRDQIHDAIMQLVFFPWKRETERDVPSSEPGLTIPPRSS